MQIPPNACSDEVMVRSMGWKPYVTPLYGPLGDRWLVFLTQDEHRILARAPKVAKAWQLAAGMVEQIDESGN